MELNLWNSNTILKEWLIDHAGAILKCDFDFGVVNPSSNYLIKSISNRLNISEDYIAISAGISELISAIFSTSLWNNVYILEPEFGLYQKVLKNSWYRERTTVIKNSDVHQISEIVRKYETEKNDILCVSSPNWYSGERITYKEVVDLLERFHGVIVLDEAYVDYADSAELMLPLVEKNERLILLRSYSKGWFVSGLRVGFMISKKYGTVFRDSIIMPHSVSSSSLRLIAEMEKDVFIMKAFASTRKEVTRIREYLKCEIEKISSCECSKSQSNFLTVILYKRSLSDILKNEFGVKVMSVLDDRIIVRYWISDKENAEQFIRILKGECNNK